MFDHGKEKEMPLITISRGIGCGGMVIARLVSDGLKLELFDDEKLQEEAIRMGYPSEDIIGIDEKAPGFFDFIFSRKPDIYLDYMEALIYEVAKKGEGVIIGHGSQMLLRDFECALHVHIQASESSRIQNLVKHKGLSEDDARKLIHSSDHNQQGFFRFAFHMNWTDQSLYDLMINTEQVGIDTAAHLIIEAARSEQIKACSLTAADAMERLALKKKIEATLLEKNYRGPWIHIEVPQKGEVEVRGFTDSLEEKARILETIKAYNGVLKVSDDIGIYQAQGC
jgi:cytidylate kinase